jgi:hypothetical protein
MTGRPTQGRQSGLCQSKQMTVWRQKLPINAKRVLAREVSIQAMFAGPGVFE